MIRFSLLLLMLLVPGRAFAFESWEHKRLGDLAYHVAWNIYCDKNPSAPECRHRVNRGIDIAEDDESLRQFYDPLRDHENFTVQGERDPKREIHEITYGDVVMCVDYFLSPDKLIAGREHNLISDGPKLKPGAAQARPEARLFPSRRVQLDISYRDRCNDDMLNLEGARSGHVNHTHFQAELLVAQRHNHILALSMRSMENNLFSALVMNAVSDHFLHDGFAPGHITTWRSRLTDLAANAYHDKVNRMGWPATADKETFRSLLTITDEQGRKHDLTHLIARQLSEKVNGAREHYLQSSFFLPVPSKDCFRKCRSQAEFDPAVSHMGLLQKIIEQIENNKVSRLHVFLRGDGDLWSADHDEQRFLMLLFEVRSILDVLESKGANEQAMTYHMVDSFRHSSWQWQFTEEVKRADSYIERRLGALNWPPSVLRAHVGALDYEMYQENDKPNGVESTVRTLDYASLDQIFGISLGADNMNFGDAQTRYVTNLETMVWGRAKAGKLANYGVVVGVQPYKSRDFGGIAVGGRLVTVLPEIETSISVPLRYIRVKAINGESSWHPTIGLRIDAGFTSFLTFYLQVTRDVAAQRDGQIRIGPSIGAGIQLAAPRCRIPLIKKSCQN
ncbi:hypothetical protein IV454_32255 [Massilia antarctica]|uniref:Uncharacterized protein n=1 Tax=Massilia antarctica TaxID=2765360 RepID=A0AA48WEG7_9BURK|nr:hypothetical protein [Massilia antarctica]QPI50017.1 hypothetical protein IV454_32255 [Massilia antarctica]